VWITTRFGVIPYWKPNKRKNNPSDFVFLVVAVLYVFPLEHQAEQSGLIAEER
jgi:predicted membrane channel-forming protein YqfA (hemolysin III family)